MSVTDPYACMHAYIQAYIQITFFSTQIELRRVNIHHTNTNSDGRGVDRVSVGVFFGLASDDEDVCCGNAWLRPRADRLGDTVTAEPPRRIPGRSDVSDGETGSGGTVDGDRPDN
jgi:hypothetical protein